MNRHAYTPSYLRRRRFLLVLPLLIIPFITMGFWALGGGKNNDGIISGAFEQKGLNLYLPNANLKKENNLDKMSYYEQASADSDKIKARMRNDPYFKLSVDPGYDSSILIDSVEANDDLADGVSNALTNSDPKTASKPGLNEKKIEQKLKEINAVLENSSRQSFHRSGVEDQLSNAYPAVTKPSKINNDARQFESAVEGANRGNSTPDSEMIQINEMLEKVMDIQHPERLNQKYRQSTSENAKPVFKATSIERNIGFYGEDQMGFDSILGNSFQAIVSDRQTVVNASTIKLQLTADMFIHGMLIPKGNFIFGKVALSGERLTVVVSSILYHNGILPVALSVFDVDGLEGIYVPGAITRDIAKQSADNALQSVALNNLDPSVAAQAAGAGIETVKSLISKKVKLLRVTVKAGYKVLIRNNESK